MWSNCFGGTCHAVCQSSRRRRVRRCDRAGRRHAPAGLRSGRQETGRQKTRRQEIGRQEKADAKAADDDPNFVLPPREGKSETIKLFNGKDLDGWEGYKDLWSVKDGVIVAQNTKPLKFSTYLLTKRKFTDFRLLFAAKLVESEMHSGVAIWGGNCAGARRQVHLSRATW